MPTNAERSWTDAQTALLRDLWDGDKPCSVIAATINHETGSRFSRNAIIGRVHRLGLPRRVSVKRLPPKPHKPRERRIRLERVRPLEPVEALMPPAEFLGVAWEVAVDDGGCMYPEGEGKHMLFCGQPRRDDSTYCPAHHRLCWVRPNVPSGKLNIWRAA